MSDRSDTLSWHDDALAVTGTNSDRAGSSQQPAGVDNAIPSASSRAVRASHRMNPGDVLSVAVHKLRTTGFDRGSEIEIATGLCDCIKRALGTFIYSDGSFWSFFETHWHPVEPERLRLLIHVLDGATIGDGGRRAKQVNLSSRTIDGILREMRVSVSAPGFFDAAAEGIPARNGLITFSRDGVVQMTSHAPEHRCRFIIEADFNLDTPMEPPADSLLYRLLQGAFQGDDDAAAKTKLVAEILGAAAAGVATSLPQPKGFVLFGPTARNGKSSIASLIPAMLPPGATATISPAAMSDERRLIHLAGKAANIADELGGAAVAGENLKACITGEPVTGRELHRSASTFRPRALHVFTTNALPHFAGGLDRGLQRRLIVLPFRRSVPESEIIPNIAARIARDELDLLLGFAVSGAQRLARQRRYTVPPSSREAMIEWLNIEPVQEWASAHLETGLTEKDRERWPLTRELYQDFAAWALKEGYKEGRIPPVNTFSQRLSAIEGIELRRQSYGREAIGARLKAPSVLY
ncbi:DNA primase family protein [Microvirga thermotolerans]|nr:DUF5906 domain-containing protein [Microvirga thermotolerans]